MPKQNSLRIITIVLATGVVVTSAANAHKPSYSNDTYGTPQSAFQVEDLSTSIVVYDHVTCDAPQVWLAFDATQADGESYFSLGVPVIDRLSDYRPSIAILAPGLPMPNKPLPFTVPIGMGVISVETDSVTPDTFNEPVSGTQSWVLFEETLTLPETGKGFVVAWDPSGRPGKLWVAVGTKERFGPSDLLKLPKWRRATKEFHEVSSKTSAIDFPQSCSQ